MATIYINDFIDLATDGVHTASSWQIALDSNFTKIIDQSLNDQVNVKQWTSPLPKVGSVGFYSDLSVLYARVKMFIDNTESDWYNLPVSNQNYQKVIITQAGKPDIITDSTAIKMY